VQRSRGKVEHLLGDGVDGVIVNEVVVVDHQDDGRCRGGDLIAEEANALWRGELGRAVVVRQVAHARDVRRKSFDPQPQQVIGVEIFDEGNPGDRRAFCGREGGHRVNPGGGQRGFAVAAGCHDLDQPQIAPVRQCIHEPGAHDRTSARLGESVPHVAWDCIGVMLFSRRIYPKNTQHRLPQKYAVWVFRSRGYGRYCEKKRVKRNEKRVTHATFFSFLISFFFAQK
jgi:hypothetical protein